MSESRVPARVTVRLLSPWLAALSVIVAAGLLIHDASLRRQGLRLVLVLMAAGEASGAFVGIFQARRMAASTGRPYDPAYHGVRQDFGFYNLAMALLLGHCALEPEQNAVVLPVAIALYGLHGGTHLLRYLGLYYGGEVPVPTRPRHFELRDALPLLVALVGMLVFHPSLGR
jgi:hypothetical protein